MLNAIANTDFWLNVLFHNSNANDKYFSKTYKLPENILITHAESDRELKKCVILFVPLLMIYVCTSNGTRNM